MLLFKFDKLIVVSFFSLADFYFVIKIVLLAVTVTVFYSQFTYLVHYSV